MASFPHLLIRQDATTTPPPTTVAPTTTVLSQNPAATNSPTANSTPNPNGGAPNTERGVGLTTRLAFVGIVLLTMLLFMSLKRTRVWRRARHLLYTRLLGRDPPPPSSQSSARRRAAGGAEWPRIAPESADMLPMPVLQERDAPPSEAADACLICLDDLDTQPVAAGPCGHWAHSDCLKLWLAKDSARTCPACRQPMVGPAAPVPSSVAATAASASDAGDAADDANVHSESRAALPDGSVSMSTVRRSSHARSAHSHGHGYVHEHGHGHSHASIRSAAAASASSGIAPG